MNAMQAMAPQQQTAVIQFAGRLPRKRITPKAKAQQPEQMASGGNSKFVLDVMQAMGSQEQSAVVRFAARLLKKGFTPKAKTQTQKQTGSRRRSVRQQPRATKRPIAATVPKLIQQTGSQRIATRLTSTQPTPTAQQKPTPEALKTQMQEFPFELLPPGTWDMEHVVNYYRRAAAQSTSFARAKIQWSRLHRLNSLKPDRCSVGREGWRGYIVFEFVRSKCVVLECPIEGNATYILSGNWKLMVGHSKLYLRTRYSAFCTKVVHKGDWLGRIRTALWT